MKFLSSFQTSALYRTLLALSPIVFLVALILLARASFDLPVSEFYQWFEGFKESSYAIPIVILTFIAGSFLALPQWALFVGVITVFGPLVGGPIAWGATLVSASLNFIVGRWAGHSRLRRFIKTDGRVDMFMKRLKKDGFMASFVVRFVPTGPFIFVNMLAGASGLRFLAFFMGTALGIIPKIAIVALLAQGLIAETDRLAVTVFFMIAAIGVALAILWLKRRYSRLE